MTWLLLISSSLLLMLGAAMLMLSRLEPAHSHISEWGWSQVFLAFGLALGVALVPPDTESVHYRVQATVATACIIAFFSICNRTHSVVAMADDMRSS